MASLRDLVNIVWYLRKQNDVCTAPTPAYSVSQPTLCPITSTINTRLWDAAVVWMQSIASVAILIALWKPKVTSVP